MFRFVYRWQAGEAWDALATEGFEGVESSEETPGGLRRLGWRARSLADAERTLTPQGTGYVTVPIETGNAVPFGHRLHALAERAPDVELLVENSPSLSDSAALWTLLEAGRHPRVRIALDVDTARLAGQPASVLVPTLNLRIGLVRARMASDGLPDYARRLAGVGYEGYVVCDPPPGPDRPAAARAIAAAFRAIFPAKPVKKAVPPKPAKA